MDTTENVEEVVENAFASFLATYHVPLMILVIVIVALLLNWLLRMLLMRTVTRIVQGVKKAQAVDSTTEIQASPYVNARAVQRTRTLGTVGRALISWTVFAIAIILILNQLEVNLGAILTSAGIVAAGLAFGAQNIVKDLLNGIFMVFEDQLGIGDWVTIGEIAGTVEDVGIRVTQVRALDGTLWFVRNGEILTLGNASQGWGRAIIDVVVDSRQDLDRVGELATASAKSLMVSEKYARKVSGDPELLGLESAYGDRATLRLMMRTRPEAKWEIERALRSAVRAQFAEAGIKMADELPKYPGGTHA